MAGEDINSILSTPVCFVTQKCLVSWDTYTFCTSNWGSSCTDCYPPRTAEQTQVPGMQSSLKGHQAMCPNLRQRAEWVDSPGTVIYHCPCHSPPSSPNPKNVKIKFLKCLFQSKHYNEDVNLALIFFFFIYRNCNTVSSFKIACFLTKLSPLSLSTHDTGMEQEQRFSWTTFSMSLSNLSAIPANILVKLCIPCLSLPWLVLLCSLLPHFSVRLLDLGPQTLEFPWITSESLEQVLKSYE